MNKPSVVFVNNLKFVLICFVVVANSIEPLIGKSVGLHMLYQGIYTFHIPMFVFAMGLLAKEFKLEHRGLRVLTIIAWQYVLFQTAYSLLDTTYFHAPNVVYSFFMPYSLLWFLCSHFCWRILLVPFLRLKHPLLPAILLGIAVGYMPWSGAILSLSRTFVYFPFFLAGYYCRIDRKLFVRLRKWRLFSTALAALWFLALAIFRSWLPSPWLYGNATYLEMGVSQWYSGLYRLALYSVQAVVSIAFLSWIPWTLKSWTGWGKRTVYVFLLHGLLLKTIIASGFYQGLETPLHMSLAFLLAAALIILLSIGKVERFTRPMFEPSLRLPKGLRMHGKSVWK
ncbi:fucose 4-O-acetylase [Paenibacillus filicis]|uniref:Fucose 4-O-acetylase n=1 Tax=Paenibacillus gyeongsangnamensis TaxID=3388067 RepID=A0ABT4QD35_9BACL|nr:fucose 4-O-acetylase [Paenibacillus filicis]MCZ8514787.1 fucose 4-O-acetylase [Paenibacillus filicis]